MAEPWIEMADGIRTETIRNDQAKLALEQRQEKELKDLRAKHKLDIERVIEHESTTKTDLERDYEVRLSSLRDEHDKRLTEVRNSNSKLLEEEKLKGEEEAEKVKARYQEQIARYRENSEKQLEELRRKTDTSAESIKRARERGKA